MIGENKQRGINELQYYELNRITPLSEWVLAITRIKVVPRIIRP